MYKCIIFFISNNSRIINIMGIEHLFYYIYAKRKIVNNFFPIITIDGPSGSGKSTLSRKLANILGWNILDSGIIYRLLALMALNNHIDINNENKLVDLAKTIKVNFINKIDRCLILFNHKEITQNVYTEFVGNIASKIAIFPKVREVLLEYQRTFSVSPGLVADGRDMGTVVFPNAILKIFLYASLEIRKRRRLYQLQKQFFNVNFEHFMVKIIQERDKRDCFRMLSPLLPADDALVLDSTYFSQEDIRMKVMTYIKKNLLLPSEILYNKYIHNQGL